MKAQYLNEAKNIASTNIIAQIYYQLQSYLSWIRSRISFRANQGLIQLNVSSFRYYTLLTDTYLEWCHIDARRHRSACSHLHLCSNFGRLPCFLFSHSLVTHRCLAPPVQRNKYVFKVFHICTVSSNCASRYIFDTNNLKHLCHTLNFHIVTLEKLNMLEVVWLITTLLCINYVCSDAL